ncbi:MAG: Brp/Blh family beta-carotene 15,15'-dioxygenase [Flavobacteriales bacterium]|jgi:Brp/Blh family beta-carotene 15,15'-monooxygenase|tara:strand:+ start:569 stop:1456 length:888 start_codon:yes stop_codon:yes gene_type:complete
MILRAKYYQFTIFLTISFIVVGLLLNKVLADAFGLFLIFSAGLIHGANDIRLLQKKYKNTQFRFFLLLILVYIGVVFLGAILFFHLPNFGLFFFILFSGFHFGQQHWDSFLKQKPSSPLLKQLGYTFYGLLVFGLLFSSQVLEVDGLIEQLSGTHFAVDTYYIATLVLAVVFSILAFFLSVSGMVYLKEILALALLAVLFATTSLLFSFAVYFVFWHSIPSIQDQLMYLDGEINRKTIKGYIRSSLVYWLLSLMGLTAAYFFFDVNASYFIPLFFTFLAAITFPHTVVIGMLDFD